MSKNTGRITRKVFDLPVGVLVKADSLIFNCHTCKKIFSPVKATLYPTKFVTYYEGVLSRLHFIIEIEEDKVCNCRIINTIYMYDTVDPMHKKFGKEKK